MKKVFLITFSYSSLLFSDSIACREVGPIYSGPRVCTAPVFTTFTNGPPITYALTSLNTISIFAEFVDYINSERGRETDDYLLFESVDLYRAFHLYTKPNDVLIVSGSYIGGGTDFPSGPDPRDQASLTIGVGGAALSLNSQRDSVSCSFGQCYVNSLVIPTQPGKDNLSVTASLQSLGYGCPLYELCENHNLSEIYVTLTVSQFKMDGITPDAITPEPSSLGLALISLGVVARKNLIRRFFCSLRNA